ncbi:hypothetical protein [Paraglaciecola sp.]
MRKQAIEDAERGVRLLEKNQETYQAQSLQNSAYLQAGVVNEI